MAASGLQLNFMPATKYRSFILAVVTCRDNNALHYAGSARVERGQRAVVGLKVLGGRVVVLKEVGSKVRKPSNAKF